MSDMQSLIEQMVSDIYSQAVQLDDFRLRLFLNWLNAHNSQVGTIVDPDGQDGKQPQREIEGLRVDTMSDSLKNGLRSWFETLPMQGLLWEYHLILNEIAWWRDLEPCRLIMSLRSKAGQ